MPLKAHQQCSDKSYETSQCYWAWFGSVCIMCVQARSVAQSCLTLWDPKDCSPSGFSVQGILQQEYWSGLPFPPPGDLPDPGMELESPTSPALANGVFTTEPLGKPLSTHWGWPKTLAEKWHLWVLWAKQDQGCLPLLPLGNTQLLEHISLLGISSYLCIFAAALHRLSGPLPGQWARMTEQR